MYLIAFLTKRWFDPPLTKSGVMSYSMRGQWPLHGGTFPVLRLHLRPRLCTDLCDFRGSEPPPTNGPGPWPVCTCGRGWRGGNGTSTEAPEGHMVFAHCRGAAGKTSKRAAGVKIAVLDMSIFRSIGMKPRIRSESIRWLRENTSPSGLRFYLSSPETY